MTEAQMWEQGGPRKRGGGRGGRGGGRRAERLMVPDATFSSYYGRAVLKRPVWQERDIAGYLFFGGLAAGSALLGAGGDITGRPALRRCGRFSAIGGLTVSTVFLIHDLGRPSRFVNMLRVLKPTSPMSIGSWLLSGFGLTAGIAVGVEVLPVVPKPLRRLVSAVATPAGVAAAAVAPAIASYTAVLLADTAVPTWHEAYPELPFVFVGSAAAASGGLAMALVPVDQASPARRMVVAGAALDLAAASRMESRLGLVGEPLHTGHAGRLMKAAKALTIGGAVVTATLGRRSRWASVIAGAAVVTGSACTRFGIFEAGVVSSEDPKYVVRPQRERLNARRQ
jgi:formate-dependent nitrite reductase membrane component NrfD